MKNLVALLCMISALEVSGFSHIDYLIFLCLSARCTDNETKFFEDLRVDSYKDFFNSEKGLISPYKLCANVSLYGIRPEEMGKDKIPLYLYCCTGNKGRNERDTSLGKYSAKNCTILTTRHILPVNAMFTKVLNKFLRKCTLNRLPPSMNE